MTGAPTRAWHSGPRGLRVAVRLTPKGGRDAIEGIEQLADGTAVLKARVRAAPHEGEANTALRMLLAKALGVAPTSVRLATGAGARIKGIEIEGDAAALARTLDALVGRAA